MQSPPPFHGYEGQPAPQKPKTNGLVILFAVLGVLLVCCGLPLAFFGYFGYKGFRSAMDMGGCYMNASLMSRALDDYVRAHDGKLPNAKTWQADLAPYFKAGKDVKDSPIKIWKGDGEWSCEEGGTKTGFAFNTDLSEKKVADLIKANPYTIAIFETKQVAYNQNSKFVELPRSESPKIMGGMIDERRGWILLTPDGHMVVKDKHGKYKKLSKNDFDMGGGSFEVDTDEDKSGVKVKTSLSSGSTNESKDDNSN